MSLHVITGPMFAGKTTELLRRGRDADNTLFIKYKDDQRYQRGTEPEVVSHNKQREPAQSVTHLMHVNATHWSTICIDEGQFFPDIATTADVWANAGKHVVVCTLVSDYNREIFPNVGNLLAKADSVQFLNATCQCGAEKAAFTSFRGKKEATQSTFVVGGSELYEPRCRKCFI